MRSNSEYQICSSYIKCKSSTISSALTTVKRLTNLMVLGVTLRFLGSLLEKCYVFLSYWYLYFYYLTHLQHYSGIYYLPRSSIVCFSAHFSWISSIGGKNPFGIYNLSPTLFSSQLYLLFHITHPMLQWSLTVYPSTPELVIISMIIYFAQESAIWSGCDEEGSSLLQGRSPKIRGSISITALSHIWLFSSDPHFFPQSCHHGATWISL